MKKNFLIRWLPISLLLAGAMGLFYHLECETSRGAIENSELGHTKLQIKSIAKDIEDIVSDIIFLSEHHEFRKLLESSQEYSPKDLTNDFLSFSLRTKRYDQIRYIGAAGKEIVRINFNNGNPYTVHDDELQFKGDRYYFKDTFGLERGKIFISPFDLNIEKGKVESPLKPMVRFGIPALDSKGQKRGVIILNYLGSILLKNIVNTSSNSLGEVMLLNSDGYWLMAPEATDEWGFMLTDRKDKRIENVFPVAWQRISKTNSGQFYSPSGLFTFETIYPLKTALGSNPLSLKAFGHNTDNQKAPDNYWKVVSRVTPATLNKQPNELIAKLVPLYIFLTLLVAIIFFIIAKTNLRRNATEEAMIKSESSLAYAQRIAHIGNWDWNIPKGELTWSDEIYRIFGLKPREFVATYEAFLNAIHPDDRDYLEKMVNAAVIDNKPYDIEHRIVLPNGMVRTVHEVGKVFRDKQDRATSMIGTIQDITNQKKTEAEVRKLSRAIEYSPATVIITDPSGKVEYVNPEFTKVTGYTCEEAIGKSPSIFKSGYTTNDEYKVLWETIISGKIWQGEFLNKKKDGGLYWESAHIAPIKNANGEITNFVAIKIDITKRKTFEKNLIEKETELLSLNEKLHLLINEVAKIEDKERKWYAEILHDVIGQDLVLIKMNIERAIEECCQDDKDHDCALSEAFTNAFSLLHKTIEKTRAITAELYPASLDSKGLIRAIEAYMDGVSKSIKININIDIDEKIEELTKDSKRTIYRLIKECMHNVIKHADASSLDITCHQDSGMFTLRIKDNGVGFDSEFSEKSNHGLGLLLMREWAGSLNAEFNINSKINEGTEILVNIPFNAGDKNNGANSG